MYLQKDQSTELRKHNEMPKIQEAQTAKIQTEMSVAISWQHLEDAVVNCQQCDIKRSATEVKHKDVFLAFLFVQSICNGCRCSIQITQNAFQKTANNMFRIKFYTFKKWQCNDCGRDPVTNSTVPFVSMCIFEFTLQVRNWNSFPENTEEEV